MTRQSDAETPGKGPLPNLDEPIKGFRKGVTKRSILNSWDGEDWKRHAERDHFQSFDRDSITAKIMLQNDSVRADRDVKIDNVNEQVNHIRNALTANMRKQEQFDSGVITDELSPGIPMNKHELEFEIKGGERVIMNTIRRVTRELASLRNVVGSHDLMKNPIMTEEEYDEFVLKTEQDLKKLGVDLFDKELHP